MPIHQAERFTPRKEGPLIGYYTSFEFLSDQAPSRIRYYRCGFRSVALGCRSLPTRGGIAVPAAEHDRVAATQVANKALPAAPSSSMLHPTCTLLRLWKTLLHLRVETTSALDFLVRNGGTWVSEHSQDFAFACGSFGSAMRSVEKGWSHCFADQFFLSSEPNRCLPSHVGKPESVM